MQRHCRTFGAALTSLMLLTRAQRSTRLARRACSMALTCPRRYSMREPTSHEATRVIAYVMIFVALAIALTL